MAPQTLAALPPELVAAVFEYLQRPSILKNLCLTCSYLRTVAQPILCREVVLDLDRYSLPNPQDFFLPNNPAQKYVRKLSFVPGFIPPEPKDPANAWKLILMAVRLIPVNRLTELILPERLEPNSSAFLQICEHQQNIQKLDPGLGGRVMSELFASPAFPRHCVAKLEVVRTPHDLNVLDELDGYEQLIKMTKSLKRLDLQVRHISWEQKTGPALNQDLVFGKLLGDDVSQEPRAVLELTQLRLSMAYLERAQEKLIQNIEFTRLTHFELESYNQPLHLLEALTRLFEDRGSALTHFAFRGSVVVPAVFEQFLGSFSGLSMLKLEYLEERRDDSLNLQCLEGHLATLKLLILSSEADDEDDVYRPVTLRLQQLDLICGQCKNLENIAIALPAVTISDVEQGLWGDFGASIDALAKLPKLRALGILNLPTAPRGCFITDSKDRLERGITSEELRELNTLRYLKHLDRFASRVYRRIAMDLGMSSATSTPFIYFGGYDDDSAHQEWPKASIIIEPVHYQAAHQTSKVGSTDIVALRTSDMDVAYEMGIDRYSDWWQPP